MFKSAEVVTKWDKQINRQTKQIDKQTDKQTYKMDK